MKRILQTLFDGRSLDRAEAERAMELVLSGTLPPEQIAAFLGALRAKKESVEELAGFASTMRAKAVPVPVRRKDLVDTCGTGGDGAETFNISTTVAFVVAGAGVGVAKHGNRSVSSRCGSADVLEALGVNIGLGPEAAAHAIDTKGFAFLFAPSYHPQLKYPGAVRKVLGVRTVFNMLGPLANPAGVRRQVVGVYDASLLEPMARVLGTLGSEEAMVVHGDGQLDEFSLSGSTRVAHFKDGAVRIYEVRPEELGLARAPVAALRGGDAVENARLVEGVLRGEKGPRRDVVLLNAAAALVVAGRAGDLSGGLRLAAESVDSGAAYRVLVEARAQR